MKNLVDRIVQFVVLVLAIGLTLFCGLAPKIQVLVKNIYPSYSGNVDDKAVIMVLSGLIYTILLSISLLVVAITYKTPIARIFDKKYPYRGTYLSLPKDAARLSIFDIKTKTSGFGTKYELKGESYSWSKTKCEGNWSSELLDLGADGNVRYIFSGSDEELTPQIVRGYASFILQDVGRTTGSGHWIDDAGGGFKETPSNYRKLIPAIRQQLMRNQPWRSQLLSRLRGSRVSRKSIVRAFAELPDEERNKHPFERPKEP
jgi:hypothetical protein